MAVAVCNQVRQAEARHPHQPEHVRLDDLALVLLGRLPERNAPERFACAVDEDVETAELGDRRLDEALAARRVGDVEPRRARGADDPCARRLERSRGRRTDTARGARDDRPLAVECAHRLNLPAG